MLVSICPLLWQRDVKLQQTNKHINNAQRKIWLHQVQHNLGRVKNDNLVKIQPGSNLASSLAAYEYSKSETKPSDSRKTNQRTDNVDHASEIMNIYQACDWSLLSYIFATFVIWLSLR